MARVMDTPATVTSAAMRASGQLYQKWLLAFEQHKARQENLSPAGKAKEAAQTKKSKRAAPGRRSPRSSRTAPGGTHRRRGGSDLTHLDRARQRRPRRLPRAALENDASPRASPTARQRHTVDHRSRLPAKQARETLADPFLTPDRLRCSFPTQQGLEEVAQQLEEQPAGCEIAGGTSHEESMILCDGCDRG